jgi:hypothetical protein
MVILERQMGKSTNFPSGQSREEREKRWAIGMREEDCREQKLDRHGGCTLHRI